MDNQKRNTLIQCAMTDGFPLSVILVLRYMCEVYSIDCDSQIANIGYLALTAVVPLYAYLLAFRFNAYNLPIRFTFWQNVRYVLYLFLFSSMILAVVQYFVYRFVVPDFLSVQTGRLVETLAQLTEVYPQLGAYGELISASPVPTAADAAVQAIISYQLGALVMAFPIAGVISVLFRKIKFD